MNKTVLILILGMAIVTYIPRVVPAVLSEKMKFSPKVEQFLQLLPYTAMAALIFPGVFLVDTAHYSIAYSLLFSLLKGDTFFVFCPIFLTYIDFYKSYDTFIFANTNVSIQKLKIK